MVDTTPFLDISINVHVNLYFNKRGFIAPIQEGRIFVNRLE